MCIHIIRAETSTVDMSDFALPKIDAKTSLDKYIAMIEDEIALVKTGRENDETEKIIEKCSLVKIKKCNKAPRGLELITVKRLLDRDSIICSPEVVPYYARAYVKSNLEKYNDFVQVAYYGIWPENFHVERTDMRKIPQAYLD